MSDEEARKAFVGFARITRLLDDNVARPIDSEKMERVYTPRRYAVPEPDASGYLAVSRVSRVVLNPNFLPRHGRYIHLLNRMPASSNACTILASRARFSRLAGFLSLREWNST